MMTAPGYAFTEISPLMRWRLLVYRCPAARELVDYCKLPVEMEPHDLNELLLAGRLTALERAVLEFLLHTWDGQEPLELSELAALDRDHLWVLTHWISDRVNGPGCYFHRNS